MTRAPSVDEIKGALKTKNPGKLKCESRRVRFAFVVFCLFIYFVFNSSFLGVVWWPVTSRE